jgi:hypothetical protein
MVAVLHVSAGLLRLQPPEFVDGYLVGALRADTVVVGPNFRFGRGAAGDPAVLAGLGETRHFDVQVPNLEQAHGAVVSSTRIRAAVSRGDMALAARLLGRPYLVRGEVVSASEKRVTLSLMHKAALPRSGRFSGRLGSAGVTPADVLATVDGPCMEVVPAGDNRLQAGDAVSFSFAERAETGEASRPHRYRYKPLERVQQ